MNIKIVISMIFAILLVGIVLSAGETTTETTTTKIDAGVLKGIGNLIGTGLNIADVNVSGIELTKDEEINTLTFLDEGVVNVKGALFDNIEKLSSLELDNKGEILFADLKATEDTSFTFKGKGTYEIPKGGRLTYEEGRITIDKADGDGILRLKQEVLDEEGKDIGKFLDIKMNGDSVDIEKIDTDSVLTGNFDMGDNKVVGIGENKVGRVTLSEKGRISEIWKGTDVTMKNITHSVLGNNLKIYYEEGFDISKHKNENYFNYGSGKIYAGGTGFTTNLGKQNNIFGDMKTTKYVKNVGTKERDLEITLNGGSLEISRDTSNPDVGFNIENEGDFIIKNGKAVIYSEKGYVIENGKRVLSDENSLFVKMDSSKEFSYDLNLNNGYTLEDNVFKDNKGNIVNLNTPEASVIYNIKNLDKDKVTEIKIALEKENGAKPRTYFGYFDEDNKEELIKWFDKATESASQNKYGVELSREELWTRYMIEGGGQYSENYPIYDYDHIGREADVSGSHLGLDYIKSNQAALEKGGFLEKGFLDKFAKEDAPLNEDSQEMETIIFDNVKDSITAFAGELARRKYVFQEDFKEAYGENKFKSMTDNEKYFWLTYYFNAGEGAGKGELTATKYTTYNSRGELITVQGKGRENVYQPWIGATPGDIESGIPEGQSARFNALISESTYKFVEELGIFNFP
jgi:hypothetical protein